MVFFTPKFRGPTQLMAPYLRTNLWIKTPKLVNTQCSSMMGVSRERGGGWSRSCFWQSAVNLGAAMDEGGEVFSHHTFKGFPCFNLLLKPRRRRVSNKTYLSTSYSELPFGHFRVSDYDLRVGQRGSDPVRGGNESIFDTMHGGSGGRSWQQWGA